MNTLRFIPPLLILLTFTTVHPQRTKHYKVWVTLMNDTKVKGVLFSANEEGILLLDYNLVDTMAYLNQAKIDVLKFRRKGNVGKGAWIGAVSGATLGAIIGFAGGEEESETVCLPFLVCVETDPPSAAENALAYGIGLAVPGTAIGALIGSGRKKYELNGDSSKYLGYLQELRTYALHQN